MGIFRQGAGLHRAAPATPAGALADVRWQRRGTRAALPAVLGRPAPLVVPAVVVLLGAALVHTADDPSTVSVQPVPVEVQATVIARPLDVGPTGTALPTEPATSGVAGQPASGPSPQGTATVTAPGGSGRPYAAAVGPSSGPSAPGATSAAQRSASTAGGSAQVPGPVAPSADAPASRAFCTYEIQSHSTSLTFFSLNIALGNVSGGTWAAWRATMTVDPAPRISSVWGATARTSGTSVTLTPVDYNLVVLDGERRTIGFQSDTPGALSTVHDVAIDRHPCVEATS